MVIDPVIYAEVGSVIASIEELDELLPRGRFRRDPMPWEASYLTGHAIVAGIDLITRDRGYARYFEISIVDPSVKELIHSISNQICAAAMQ